MSKLSRGLLIAGLLSVALVFRVCVGQIVIIKRNVRWTHVLDIHGNRMEQYGKLDLVRFDFDCPQGSQNYMYVGRRGLVETLTKLGKPVVTITLEVYGQRGSPPTGFKVIEIEGKEDPVLPLGAGAEGPPCEPFQKEFRDHR